MNRKGFTLIELLIVVAIIGILAAIAIPNFLQAQIRAKVARVKSEHRSIMTALEAYAVDHNYYPRNTYFGTYNSVTYADVSCLGTGNPVYGTIHNDLSSPIDYISTVCWLDPLTKADLDDDLKLYTYQNLKWYGFSNPSKDSWIVQYGGFRIGSVGPDQSFGAGGAQVNYDPTNGTISNGNIWRCQNWATPAVMSQEFVDYWGF